MEKSLDELLAEAEVDASKQDSEVKDEVDVQSLKDKINDLESKLVKKDEIQFNLTKALQKERTKKVDVKKDVDEEEIPEIDMTDINSKAWDKHIKEKVNPLAKELQQEKDEIFRDVLGDYLEDHPELKDDSKFSEFISTYDKLKASSGRTVNGLLRDFDKARGATLVSEFDVVSRNERVDEAIKLNKINSFGINKDTSKSFKSKEDKTIKITEAEWADAAAGGWDSPEEYLEAKKKFLKS